MPTRAAEWIRECQSEQPFPICPEAVGGYDNLLARDDIDAVYIPLPTGLRKEWVIRAAQAGKHVLCEKPCGNTASDVEEMIAACHDARVQFMDGVMFMHGDRLAALRRLIDDGTTIGALRHISSQFSFPADEAFLAGGNIRVRPDLESLGCLGDVGWYNLRLSLWAMNWEMPAEATGRIIGQNSGGVPTEFSGELVFRGGATASFYCSFVAAHQQWARLSGTRGAAEVRDFVLPFFGAETYFTTSKDTFETEGCDFRMASHSTRHVFPEHGSSHATAPDTKLFRHFAELALSGKPDDHWPRIALQTQRVLEACLNSARNQGRPVALS